MKKWKTYHSDVSNEKFDLIIIGSGIGGLCATALLGIKGKRVLVLEKHFKICGWTHTFKRKDYEWDVGIQDITTVGVYSAPFSGLLTTSTVLGQDLSSHLKD